MPGKTKRGAVASYTSAPAVHIEHVHLRVAVIERALAFSSVLTPLDVAVSLGMELDLASHANLAAEFTVGLPNGRVEIPVRADFDFFQDVDAIFTAIAVPRFACVCKPLFPATVGRKPVQSGHQDRHHAV
jgi:hypothetical protein